MGHRTPKHLQGYRAPLAYRIAGLPYYTGDYLARTGVVVPSVATADGHWTARLYSFQDLVALRVVAELRRARLSLQRIRKCVVVLQEEWRETLATARLLTNGKDAYLVCDEKKAVSLLMQPGQYGWRACVDVRNAAAEVRRLLAQEKPEKRAKVAEANRRKTA